MLDVRVAEGEAEVRAGDVNGATEEGDGLRGLLLLWRT